MSLTGVMPSKTFKGLVIKVLPVGEIEGQHDPQHHNFNYYEDLRVTLNKNGVNHEVNLELNEGELSACFDQLWKHIGKLLEESILEDS